jgi:hypothetical protein
MWNNRHMQPIFMSNGVSIVCLYPGGLRFHIYSTAYAVYGMGYEGSPFSLAFAGQAMQSKIKQRSLPLDKPC